MTPQSPTLASQATAELPISAFNIPAGFALVPLEPTEDMWTAGRDPVMHRDLNHKPALFPCDAGECPAWQRNPKTGNPELDTSKGTTAVHVWRAMLAAAPTPPVDAVPGEPVMWQSRFFDSTSSVTPGWGKWEEVVPRNAYTDTVEDRLRELRHYIAAGYKYELRALYAIAPTAATEPSEETIRAAFRKRDGEFAMQDATAWQVWRDAVAWALKAATDRERAASLVASEGMLAAFRTTEVHGHPDGAKQRFRMVFTFPTIEALHAADDEWRASAGEAQS